MSVATQYDGPFPRTNSSLDVSKSMRSVYAVIARGFVLEHHKQFAEAISAHHAAIDLLQGLMPKIKKVMLKVHRVMFERQLDVLREREAILDRAALANPPFTGFIAVPTILSADAELIAAVANKHTLLSLVCALCLLLFFSARASAVSKIISHLLISLRTNKPCVTSTKRNRTA